MDTPLNERIVTIGGGTGSYTMLSALKKVSSSVQGIVAMTDSGGSSRRLMDEFGRPLPLGDLRQALVALSRSSTLWRSIFAYRFPDSHCGNLGGHSLGNLILHALEDLNSGDLMAALDDAGELLNSAGRALPVTLDQATLCAELADGTIVRGETNIDVPNGRPVLPIKRVFLEPRAAIAPAAKKALERADTVLIGPGDLYTSVIPCLLVDGVAEVLRVSEARVVYICNVMTKHGETDGFAASDFVREIHRYLRRPIDAVVVNTARYPAAALADYARAGAQPVQADLEALAALVPQVVTGAFAHAERLIRHNAEAVVHALWPEPARGAGSAAAAPRLRLLRQPAFG